MSATAAIKALIPQPLKRVLRAVFPAPAASGSASAPVSTDYERVTRSDLSRVIAELDGAWRDPGIPQAQLQIVDAELAKIARGERVPVYDVFLDLLKRVPGIESKTLLEVGCASGYYSNVLRSAGWNTTYAGCDFSSAFVALARNRAPGVDFQVQDATKLTYPSKSFDVVVSGCCILHIVDYAAAIRESARVARDYVLFHRTPVLQMTETAYYRKRAYGVECIEIHFNEGELFRLFDEAGLRVQDVQAVGLGSVAPAGDALVVKSYLCRVS
jgi:SAM-dependent methyltransferase